ncbi:putative rlpA-like protein, double-psi beta-barrel [Helianthus annuus]|nr:putative EG45-like domain containing protein, plant [Helianthus annuus]KAJ0541187.1 putative EG45-like domain containing protein, plant [Helianthus annuus]KAJ0706269.1 putative EG45-like domain containing protein, plant [Helianthus annuus]KAJ0886755.1 putative rlpA-like protein, double-psi beta-barrel [Helianthus annuus]
MNVVTKALILISMMVCLTSVANAISGEAIIYRPPYAPSRCFGPKDQGVMVARAHGSLFAYGKACGWKYRVRCTSGKNKAIPNACTGNTVDVTIVDRCETCGADVLELSQEAFAQIARPELGKVDVEYAQI